MSALRSFGLAIAFSIVGCAGGTDPSKGPGAPSDETPSVPIDSVPGHETLPLDGTPKEGPRLIPAETYMRTYLALFGGLSPLEVQAAARGKEGELFDRWADYVAGLGLPEYAFDLPRNSQTNALMVATFERLGIALCARAVERDLKDPKRPEKAKRVIFAFDLPTGELDLAGFTERFDVLHRTFLGYPAALAQTDRTAAFFDLYKTIVSAHGAKDAPKTLFTPAEAGWAAVCYGLVRHPEFHTY